MEPLFLLCPICREALTWGAHRLTCSSGHHFDRAREGYVNLLQLKRTPKFMGDSKVMLRARRSFLAQGHYAPLMAKMATLINGHIARPMVGTERSERAYTLCDIGCGEGSYTNYVARHIDNILVGDVGGKNEKGKKNGVTAVGMDMAKEAVRMAAKSHPCRYFFVADVNQPLLLANQSVDLILNIFAPRNASEFARVLHHDGLLFMVIPAPDHLESLRSRFSLLSIQSDKAGYVIQQMASAGLQLVSKCPLSFSMRLSAQSLLDLIQMTPNQRHLGEDAKALVDTIDAPFSTTASFQLMVFARERS
ncbi:MAG: putative RNA methyltransferase [Chloroflexota bacterium]